MQTLTNNFAEIARLMNCSAAIVARLVEKRLLPISRDGNVSPQHALQFLRNPALTATVGGIRRELAAEKAAAESAEQERVAAIESLENKITLAMAAREFENVANLQIALRKLETNKGEEC